jgi:hypothetical protein
MMSKLLKISRRLNFDSIRFMCKKNRTVYPLLRKKRSTFKDSQFMDFNRANFANLEIELLKSDL